MIHEFLTPHLQCVKLVDVVAPFPFIEARTKPMQAVAACAFGAEVCLEIYGHMAADPSSWVSISPGTF